MFKPKPFISMLYSGWCTLLLFLVAGGYLFLGKVGMLPLAASGMLILAGLLAVQAGLVLLSLVKSFRAEGSCFPWKTWGEERLFHVTPCAVERSLSAAGYRLADSGNGLNEQRWEKRWQSALMAAIAAYTGILILLAGGFLNYGFALGGHFILGESIAWVRGEGNFQIREQGVFVGEEFLDYEFLLTKISPSQQGQPASVALMWRDNRGGSGSVENLKSSEIFHAGGLSLQFKNDSYLAFPTVKKKDFNFMAAAITLLPNKEQSGYAASLDLAGDDVRGNLEYEPSRGKFSAILKDRSDRKLFAQTFGFNEIAKEGEYFMLVDSLGHYATFEIVRRSFRTVVFVGAALAIVGTLIRICLRPERLCVFPRDGQVLVRGKTRILNKMAQMLDC